MIDHDCTAVDSETELVRPGLAAPPLACVTTCDGSLEPKIYHWEESFEVLRELYNEKNLVLQNGPYDSCVFAAQFPELLPTIFKAYEEKRIVDTQYNDQLIQIARGTLKGYKDHRGVWHDHYYNLSALSERYGFGTLEKDQHRLTYGELRKQPLHAWPQGAQDYALLDAKRTLQIFFKQLEYSAFLVDAAAQARAYFALRLSTCRGMITDARQCQEFIDATELDIERAKRVLLEHGLMREEKKRGQVVYVKNTKVAKARMEKVCTELGIPVPKTKPAKGVKADWKPGVRCDAEATRDSGDPVLQDYSFYTSADKARTRALVIQKGSTGVPIQCDWGLVNTGRVSSYDAKEDMLDGGKLIGDNLTNLPRAPGLRECFIPRKGFVFCSLDLDQAEAVALAQEFFDRYGTSTLGEALRSTPAKDIHCILAAVLLNCPYEEVLANKKHGKYARERQNAKYGNYGGFGGMGPRKFMATTNAKIDDPADRIDLATATRIINGLKIAWAPEFPRYLRDASAATEQGLAMQTHAVSGRIRGGLDYSEFLNNPFQGRIADGIKEAYFFIQQEMFCDRQSPLFGSRLLLDLHDELFAELLEDRAHEAAFRMQKILLNVFNSKYTRDVPIHGEPALAYRWFKSTPSLFVDGELVPAKPQVDGQDVRVLPKKQDNVVWVPDLRRAA